MCLANHSPPSECRQGSDRSFPAAKALFLHWSDISSAATDFLSVNHSASFFGKAPLTPLLPSWQHPPTIIMHSDKNNGQPACKAFIAFETPRAKPHNPDVILRLQAKIKSFFLFIPRLLGTSCVYFCLTHSAAAHLQTNPFGPFHVPPPRVPPSSPDPVSCQLIRLEQQMKYRDSGYSLCKGRRCLGRFRHQMKAIVV